MGSQQGAQRVAADVLASRRDEDCCNVGECLYPTVVLLAEFVVAGAQSAKCADVRAGAAAIRAAIDADYSLSGDAQRAVHAHAALDALVASLAASRREADAERALREQIEDDQWPYEWQVATAEREKRKAAELALAAARQREQQLTQALRFIAAGEDEEEGVLDWADVCESPDDFDPATIARAVLAGEAPPTAPPESARQEQPDDAADAEADS